jgi:CrcB protein
MPVVVAVAVGGALGAASRYGLDRVIERRSFAVFPWSTFTINLSGCFLIGLVIAALVEQHQTPAWLHAGLVVGVLGGYTTFSTFAQEALDLLRAEDIALALLYSLGSITGGVLAVLAGTALGRMV